jgi:hypothetical protein
MRQGCVHAASIQPVPAPRDVCEACIVEGTEWVHLRQCLVCGQTLCCNDSPRRHMTGHWEATGHPVMRNASPGEKWTWCFVDDAPIRPAGDAWETFDPFVEAGTEVAASHYAAGVADPGPDFVSDDGFPLGDWVAYVRDAHGAGDLDPADVAAIEAIPGWRWTAG